MPEPRLTLASRSPRRSEILSSIEVPFDVSATEIDETRLENELPADMVVRLALSKARAVAARTTGLVLGADTAVVLGERVFGKPADENAAIRTLLALGGTKHEVMTGVALIANGAERTALSVTEVRFRDIGRDEARRYWQSGEPRDKAGAYAIQGRGGVFVEAIMGSFTGVMGLPVYETAGLLTQAGMDL
ncbi:MAG: Maf family protein [Woeseiaceae bacterium]